MQKQNVVMSVIGAVLIASMAFSVGCASGPNPQQTAGFVRIAAQLGTYEAVQHDPSLRTPLQLAAVSITGMCNSGVFDQVALELAINDAFGGSPQNALYMQTALAIYDGYIQSVIQDHLGTNQYIRPVTCAIGAGIADGLNAPATVVTFKLKPVVVQPKK